MDDSKVIGRINNIHQKALQAGMADFINRNRKSLRDEFAAAALPVSMQMAIDADKQLNMSGERLVMLMATSAYNIADAMMKVREL